MKRLLLSIIVFGLSLLHLIAQTTHLPGGVNSIAGWYICEPTQDETQVAWKNQLTGSRLPFLLAEVGHPIFYLNFNPVTYIQNPLDGLDIPMGIDDLDQITLFVVYQLNDTLGEKGIWTWSKNGNQKVVLTSKNIIDFDSQNTSQTQAVEPGKPSIGTYLHRKQQDTLLLLEQYLQIGGTGFSGGDAALPFLGKVAEIIWYDRVLAGAEKQQVESYLALKYGIPLSQSYLPSSYLNSNGDIVWDAKRNKSFSSNIAGIGRDDRSGLYQKQSTCSNESGMLTIGAGTITDANANNSAFIPDMNFLVWSDNDLDLELGPDLQGQPTQFLRTWKISCTAEMKEIKTTLQFDTKEAEIQPGEGETWWLLIDKTGSGSFPSGQVVYKKVVTYTSEKNAEFKDVFWDTDDSGTDCFTFGIAPEMFAKVWVTPPVCAPLLDGVMHIGAEGGDPPYYFSLINEESGYSFSWTNTDNSLIEVDAISPGYYTLRVSDSRGGHYIETLFIQSSDAPESNLLNSYILKQDQILCLDASEGVNSETPVSYRWVGPDGVEIPSPTICISTPGTFLLFMDRNGCHSKKKIEVQLFEESNFKELRIFPNPVEAGKPFTILIKLNRDALVEMDIFDIMSRKVAGKIMNGNNFYRFSEQAGLPPGVYFVTFRSENKIQTRKIVIE